MGRNLHGQTRQKLNPRMKAFRKCPTHKVGHGSYDEALTAAERSMERGHVEPGCHLTPYRCSQCGEWHVRNRFIVFRKES